MIEGRKKLYINRRFCKHLQSLFIIFDQANPEDMTMTNFRHVFDGYLEEILADRKIGKPVGQYPARWNTVSYRDKTGKLNIRLTDH
ncbi:MAG: hypothetical protein OXC17_01830 [Aestuariivita sp.]|nr:hypothetical protein [Aestuariivita sp.]